jgi:biopolymer transport protein ExbB
MHETGCRGTDAWSAVPRRVAALPLALGACTAAGAQEGPAPSISALPPHDLSPLGMFMSADIVVKAVMVGLAFASVVTWTVWMAKSIELVAASRRLRRAVGALEGATSLHAAAQAIGGDKGDAGDLVRAAAAEVALSRGLSNAGIKERIASRFERVEAAAARRMTRGTGTLATIGSTAPFVGLFGTVWGIYHALTAIGIAGQASIDKVAGPVGEALIMTAIGLATAVPAVLGYNWLVRRNKGAMERVRNFSSDLHSVLLGGVRVGTQTGTVAPQAPATAGVSRVA